MTQHSAYNAPALVQLFHVVVLGVFFGISVAVVAHLFVEGVRLLSDFRTEFPPIQMGPILLHYGQVITLTIAGLVIYAIKIGLNVARWQGPADTIYGAHRPDNELDVKDGLSSTLAAFVSASGGASVGQYGPLVHFGAVIGSAFKQFLKIRLSTDVFIGCGVAAAISSGFGAPIAGVVFAHEAILRHFSLRAIAPIAIASCVAAGVGELFWPEDALFNVEPFAGDLSQILPVFLLLGPIFGVVAVGLMQSVRQTQKFTTRRGLGAASSLSIAVILTSIGGAFVPEALGLGGKTIDGLLDQTYTPIYILFIFAMKLALTAVCLGFGLFGGIFSPSLVIGASAGAIVFYIGHTLGLDPAYGVGLVICAMAAVSTSVIGAPLAGMMIVLELTGSYEYALLAMVSIVTSVLTSHLIFGQSFFDKQLSDRGIDISSGRTGIEMMERCVASIAHNDCIILTPNCLAQEAIKSLLKGDSTEAYILDHENRFEGKVTLQILISAAPDAPVTNLLMDDPIFIKSDASLQQSMEVAVEFVGESIPIIDESTNIMIGVVTEADLFKDYLSLQNKIVDLERR